MNLPDFLRRFFWDVSFADLDGRADYYFVLERLLEYGDDRAIRWLLSYYTNAERIEVVKSSPRLSPKTGCFWKCYYGLQEEDVRCLRPPSHRQGTLYWNA